MLKRIATTLTACALALPAGAATQTVDETIKVRPGGTVSLELLEGQVHFIGWDRSEVWIAGVVEVSGHRGDDDSDELIDISSDGVDVDIEIEYARHGRNYRRGATELEIHVPYKTAIDAETVSADISVEGARGEVSIESVNGDIRVEGEPREVELGSVNGNIDLKSAAPVRSGHFESVSGNMDLSLELASNARISMESVNGNIVLRLSDDVSAEFAIETFSGSIENELGPQARKTSQYLPAKTLEFSLGAGGARVIGESFNGRIELLRQ